MNILSDVGVSSYSGIILIFVMIVAMYFLMIRPQRKQQKQHQNTLSQLQKGDHVTTIGRLHGVVDEINREDRTVTLDCDGIYLVFDLNAVASVNQKNAVPEKNDDSVSTDTESTTSESTTSENTTSESTTSESTMTNSVEPDNAISSTVDHKVDK